jgi:hypothetical protein
MAHPTRFERVTFAFGARRLRANGQNGRIACASRFGRGNCLPALYTPEQIDGRSIDDVVASSRAFSHLFPAMPAHTWQDQGMGRPAGAFRQG